MNNFAKCLLLLCMVLISGCKPHSDNKTVKFVTSAEYPPFEYHDNGVVKGFDIDLAKLIAKKLGKKAEFENVQFSAVMPSLQSAFADIAISTISITADRQKNFDFSDPYYHEEMVMVYQKDHPIHNLSQIPGKKIGAQLGSTMEIYLKEKGMNDSLIVMNNNNLMIESVLNQQLNGVLMDGMQGKIFTSKHPELAYSTFGLTPAGYGLAFQKNSPLRKPVNVILNGIKQSGELEALKKKWLE